MGSRIESGTRSPVLTVAQLHERVRDALDAGLERCFVVGEISGLRIPASGHCYFTLKDSKAQIAAVLFRSALRLVPFQPKDGMEVIAQGRVGVYEARGTLQFYVETLEPKGLGALQLALEELKRKLAAEGLFAEERKRPLPFLPRGVGVVTALRGAAIHDILVTLRARWPGLYIVVRPVRVQGKEAVAEIAAAIAEFDGVDEVDVLIVGRGGGSLEDLWAFNDEAVARAIAAARVPVVSAVGHEIDFTLADLVADRRAATPTAAAAMVVPERRQLAERLVAARAALRAAAERSILRHRTRLQAQARHLRDPRRVLAVLQQRVDELGERAARAAGARVRSARQQLRAASEHLHALSPLAVLDRGYSITRHADTRAVVRSADALRPGDRLHITFAAGFAGARVEDVPALGAEIQENGHGAGNG